MECRFLILFFLFIVCPVSFILMCVTQLSKIIISQASAAEEKYGQNRVSIANRST